MQYLSKLVTSEEGKGQLKINQILKALSEGKTIYICTPLRKTKITQKTVDKFNAFGKPVLKGGGDSMYMFEHGKYACIDFAKIIVESYD